MLSKKVERFVSGIYKITNLINNKIYIGSSVDMYSRKHTHNTRLNKNTHCNQHLQNSFNKYGENNFLFEVIEYCDSNVLIEREQYYINKLSPEYNKREAEENLNIGTKRPKEVIEKMSKSMKQRYKEGLKAYNQKHKWKVVQQFNLKGELIREYEAPHVVERLLSLTSSNIYIRHVNLNIFNI